MRQFYLFTNRNCIVFDDNGLQDAEAQSKISCYEIQDGAQGVLDACGVFYIASWRTWRHEVTKKEIEYLLGLRDRDRDLRELRNSEEE